jgi:hypothetical protein
MIPNFDEPGLARRHVRRAAVWAAALTPLLLLLAFLSLMTNAVGPGLVSH